MRSGRPPKPPDQRRNRNKPTHEWVVLPDHAPKGRVPNLPKALGLSVATHDWWRSIWKTPMANMWAKADVHALIELAVLRDTMMSGKVSLAAEVRRREDDFGLTVAGRRALRWIVPNENEEHRTEAKPLTDEVAKRRKERAQRLAAGDD